jgi:U5 small nuclear ribonucleoprotein component
LANTKGKTYALTLIDCPGHNQFHDESVAALRSVDGVILTLDVVEGIQLHTKMLIGQIITEGLPLVLLFTKVDRLIVELKLSPMDAYAKIQYGIDSINQLIQEKIMGIYPLT